MPVEIQPPELAQLLDFAERPRAGDWSMRAALCRYAQPRPMAVSEFLQLGRRITWALGPHSGELEADGDALWAALASGPAPADGDGEAVALLRAALVLDRAGDRLAEWAVARAAAGVSGDGGAVERPDAVVDEAIVTITSRLEEMGIEEEPREPPPGYRSRGRGV